MAILAVPSSRISHPLVVVLSTCPVLVSEGCPYRTLQSSLLSVRDLAVVYTLDLTPQTAAGEAVTNSSRPAPPKLWRTQPQFHPWSHSVLDCSV